MTMIIRLTAAALLVCCSAGALPLTPEALEAGLPHGLLSATMVLDVQVAYMNHPLAGISPTLPAEGASLQILPYEARLAVLKSLPGGGPVEMRLQGLTDACWMPGVGTRALLLASPAEGRLTPAGDFPTVGFYPVVDGKAEFPPFSGNRVASAALMTLLHDFLVVKTTGVPTDSPAPLERALKDSDPSVRVAAAALFSLVDPEQVPAGALLDNLEAARAAAMTSESIPPPSLMLLLVSSALPRLEPRLLALVREDLSSPAPAFSADALSDLLLRKAVNLSPPERREALLFLCTPVTVTVGGRAETRRIAATLAGVEKELIREPGGDLTEALYEMAASPDRFSCLSQPSELAVLWRILMARDAGGMKTRLEDFLGGRAPLKLPHPLSVSDEALLREVAQRLVQAPPS
jgi:hypothetical protein